jgi:hypothetical protein
LYLKYAFSSIKIHLHISVALAAIIGVNYMNAYATAAVYEYPDVDRKSD